MEEVIKDIDRKVYTATEMTLSKEIPEALLSLVAL